MFPNITQLFLLQTALQIVFNRLSTEIETHTTCIISSKTYNEHFIGLDIPKIRFDCESETADLKTFNKSSPFVKKLMWGINNGCAYFLVSQDCVFKFLTIFGNTHFYSLSKYNRKVLVVLGNGTKFDVLDILNNKVILKEIPLTLLIEPPDMNLTMDDSASIDIYSCFPFTQLGKIRNKFYLSNVSFDHNSSLIPKIYNFQGAVIKAGIIHFPPFTSGVRVPPGTGNTNTLGSNDSLSTDLGGQEGYIMLEFCKKFNCTLYTQFDYQEALWGEIYPNLTGRGLLGDIATQEVELAVGSFYLVLNRYNSVQYCYVIQMSTVTHALPKAKPLPYWYIPVLPLSPYAWLCFVASLFIGAGSLLLLDRARLDIFPHSTVKRKSIMNGLFTVLKITVNQNVTVLTNIGSSLIMYSFFMIFALTLGSFYIGGLSSLMTILPTEKPIDTIAKLVQTNLVWGTTSITFVFPVQQSTDPAFVRYVKNFKVHSVTDFHKIVKQEKAAVIVETMQGGTLSYQAYIDRNDSKFLMVQKDPLYTAYTGIIAIKTWPYMEQLNRIVFMQAESGIGTYWEHKSMEQSMDYEIQKNIIKNTKHLGSMEPVKLSVPHILGPLFILLFGHVFGTIAFIFEVLWGNDKRFVKVFRRKFRAVVKVLKSEV